MQRYEHASATSRLSRRSLLIGGGAAALALAMPGAIRAASYPLPRLYLHQEWLIDAGWLKQELDAVKVVALMPIEEFEAGHIPGAAQIDWPDLLFGSTTASSIDRWQATLQEELARLNITPDDRVVVYDGGSLLAARLWWALDMLGHAHKQILNGGLPAWQAAGGQIETGPSTVQPATAVYAGTLDRSKMATQGEVMEALNNPAFAIVDARDPAEFDAGRIPSAINYNFLYNAEDGPVKVIKSADVLVSTYAGLGITTDKTVVTYCGSGERACVSYFTLRLLGYPNVRVYAGSWEEWASSAYVPVEYPGHDAESGVIVLPNPPRTCAHCTFDIGG